MTSRERVIRTLEFKTPDRIPRDLWWVLAVVMTQEKELTSLLERIPTDIDNPHYKVGLTDEEKERAAKWIPGLWKWSGFVLPKRGQKYRDEWGSIRYFAEDGVGGEVKEPVLDDLSKINKFSPPWHLLESVDLREVNRYCAESKKFMLSALCAHPFERLQYILGSEKFFVELGYGSKELFKLRDMVHEYSLRYLKMWLETDVDGIWLMDDWGAQHNLLISPSTWREFLKPLYKEYCELVHEHNKYVFFHSDGWIEPLFDDVIEIGVDAMNCQLFCMDIEKLARKYKGKITFWGEIDRQKILPFGNQHEVTQAVYRIRRAFDNGTGGVIAQCEWGKNNPVKNIEAVFNAWSEPLGETKK